VMAKKWLDFIEKQKRRSNLNFGGQILGSKFWELGELNQKSKKSVLQRGHEELTAKKWLDWINKQKKEAI